MTTEVPFPEWVPSSVRAAARRLGEESALARLAPGFNSNRRSCRGTTGRRADIALRPTAACAIVSDRERRGMRRLNVGNDDSTGKL